MFFNYTECSFQYGGGLGKMWERFWKDAGLVLGKKYRSGLGKCHNGF